MHGRLHEIAHRDDLRTTRGWPVAQGGSFKQAVTAIGRMRSHAEVPGFPGKTLTVPLDGELKVTFEMNDTTLPLATALMKEYR